MIATQGRPWPCPICRTYQTGTASDLSRNDDLEVIVNLVRNNRGGNNQNLNIPNDNLPEQDNPVQPERDQIDEEQSCLEKIKNMFVDNWKAIIGSLICLGTVLSLRLTKERFVTY